MTLLQQEQEQQQQHKTMKNSGSGNASTRDTTSSGRTTHDAITREKSMLFPITIQNKKIMSILYPQHVDNVDHANNNTNNNANSSLLPNYSVEMIDQLVQCLLSHSSLVFKTIEGRGLFKAAEKAPLKSLRGDGSATAAATAGFSDLVQDQNQDGDYTGYDNVWVRDNIHVAHTHYLLSTLNLPASHPLSKISSSAPLPMAKSTLADIAAFWLKYKNRWTDCVLGRVDFDHDVTLRPHIRFNGTELRENDQHWSHAQNDAIGYFLWLFCKIALESTDSFDLSKKEWSFFSAEMVVLICLYHLSIQFWQDKDNGHWEEARKVEASSVGAATAGYKMLLSLLESNSSISTLLESQFKTSLSSLSASGLYEANLSTHIQPPLSAKTSLHDLVSYLFAMGKSSLAAILPFESRDKGHERDTDAALLFLLYPLDIVSCLDDHSEKESRSLSSQIAHTVSAKLSGKYGIRRYNGDSYWMANYTTLFSKETRTQDFSDDMSLRDALLVPGQEAQWCIFDSILSAIYSTAAPNTPNHLYPTLASYYLTRALGQITGDECRFGPFLCPESYYLAEGKWVVNDVCPLLWTQANLVSALVSMRKYLCSSSS